MTNREVVNKWQAIIDSKVFDELEVVESSEVENINPSGTIKGILAHKKMLQAFAVAFPDYIHDNINFAMQGDWVAIEGVFRGINSGPFAIGERILEATNNKIELPYCGFIKVENGKIVENRLYYDSNTFLSQLGR